MVHESGDRDSERRVEVEVDRDELGWAPHEAWPRRLRAFFSYSFLKFLFLNFELPLFKASK